jgi:hypothetical protein
MMNSIQELSYAKEQAILFHRALASQPAVPVSAAKGGYTLVTLLRTGTPYRDRVDGTCDHVTHQKLVTRQRYEHVRCAVGIWPSHQRDDTVTA